jgi:hypothetical protein
VKFALGEAGVDSDEVPIGIIDYMSFHPEERPMNLPLKRGDKK